MTSGNPVIPRLALLADYLEERWFSMDFCAEMLHRQLQTHHAAAVESTHYIPRWCGIATKTPILKNKRAALNADRMLNRFLFYPRLVKPLRPKFDLFHVVDHTYAQLVHKLPPQLTGVFCHDIDAFRSILEPVKEPRPRWYRKMARHQLAGMQKAALVFYTTDDVRRQIDQFQLIDPVRLVKAPLGIAMEYTPQPDPGITPSPQVQIAAPYVLHVGSCMPRKRLDVLLDVFAGLRARHPDLRLVRVGDPFPADQQAQAERLGLTPFIIRLTNLPRTDVAHLYRNARVSLLPSDNEGFGLPLIEALACGTIVVASDLPVLHEVGGDAVIFAPPADLPIWIATVSRVLDNPETAPPCLTRLAQAAKYSWQSHANTIWLAYEKLLKESR